jgi:hypothetical protein
LHLLEFEPQIVQAVALWLHQMCSPGPLEMFNLLFLVWYLIRQILVWSTSGMIVMGETPKYSKKPVLACRCVPQITHGLTSDCLLRALLTCYSKYTVTAWHKLVAHVNCTS